MVEGSERAQSEKGREIVELLLRDRDLEGLACEGCVGGNVIERHGWAGGRDYKEAVAMEVEGWRGLSRRSEGIRHRVTDNI
jgi:hypothetical protein